MMIVTMQCGCRIEIEDSESGTVEPRCALHNCTVVARVNARLPRFRGSPGVTGPLVEEEK